MTKLVSALSKREREFIEKLQRNVDVKKHYPNVTVRQLKFRLLTKRKILTEDLLLLNAVLDKLQSL
jgi:hypothetical protein